jgi:hypothetical protein
VETGERWIDHGGEEEYGENGEKKGRKMTRKES